MSKKTIIDILQGMDQGKLTFQMLSQCLDGKQSAAKDGGTRFTFLTDETLVDVAVFQKRDAVLVWVDKEEFIRSVNAAKWEGKLNG